MAATTARGRWRATGETTHRADPALKCRQKFLRYFPKGFRDETYVDWERDYKWQAHKRWVAALDRNAFARRISDGEFTEIARTATAIESRTNLLFSFEKMALRDAVKPPNGARAFAEGLFDFLHGDGTVRDRFERWVSTVATLPRKQTRVLTWPLATVFGFIAQPRTHFFLKPMVTRLAAKRYGYALEYQSKPSWETYESVLGFAAQVKKDVNDLAPRDMIDLQSFIWVQGSEEYP
jgi:hypothetical protein